MEQRTGIRLRTGQRHRTSLPPLKKVGGHKAERPPSHLRFLAIIQAIRDGEAHSMRASEPTSTDCQGIEFEGVPIVGHTTRHSDNMQAKATATGRRTKPKRQTT